MKATEIIFARGHTNVQSSNKTTFEVTKETFLTKRGDCIVAVGANKGASDLSPEFKDAIKKERAHLTITIEAGEQVEVAKAWGSPQLSLTHPTDLVVRKSSYVCERTLAIRADKAARDFSRKLIEKLRSPDQKVKVTLTVEETI